MTATITPLRLNGTSDLKTPNRATRRAHGDRDPLPTDDAPVVNIATMTDAEIVAAVLAGDVLPSAVMGRADLYDALKAGATGKPVKLLGSSAKVLKGLKVGVLSAVLYMMPERSSGRQACAYAGGCADVCLAEQTGRMSHLPSRRARRRRHALLYADQNRFLADLHVELQALALKAERKGLMAAGRLNGTTDLPWHRMPFTAHDGTRHASLYVAVPEISFYEYTKVPLRLVRKGGIPANLSLTFSVSEDPRSDAFAAEYLADGRNVAVVMFAERHALPETFALAGDAWPVIDGDLHDARFLDEPEHVVGLAAKGRAKKDESGFVREVTR